MQHKLTLIDRATKPVWRYRCPRWPPSKGLLQMEGRLQNRMITVAQRLRPSDGETAAAFIIRRNRAAAVLARSRASWADEHLKLCTTWMEHLLRPANSHSFASVLLRHKDAAWLQSCRKHLRPHSAQRRAATRRMRGFIVPRWEEALLHRLAGF